jgi:hypothetical protein
VDINKEILTKDINEVLKAKYSLSNWLQIIKIDKKFIYLYDWINFISFYLELIYKSFLNNFNHNIYLIENLKSNQVEVNEQDLRYLLENRILIIRNGSY